MTCEDSKSKSPFQLPDCEEAVIEKIRLRRDAGRKKYNCTMDRLDLSRIQWLRHAQEEAMDLAIYLERCIREECPKSAATEPPLGSDRRPKKSDKPQLGLYAPGEHLNRPLIGSTVADWQPIETAPKNAIVLLYCPGIDPTNIERVEIGKACFGRYFTDGNPVPGTWGNHAWATHWAMLPPPPNAKHE